MNYNLFKRDPKLEPIDLTSTYTLLHSTGEVERVTGGYNFQQIPRMVQNRIGKHWLLSKHYYSSDWTEWVMHPACDELIYLLSGSMSILLDYGKHRSVVSLHSNDVTTIPRGVWHTVKIQTPCEVLEISRNLDTKRKKYI